MGDGVIIESAPKTFYFDCQTFPTLHPWREKPESQQSAKVPFRGFRVKYEKFRSRLVNEMRYEVKNCLWHTRFTLCPFFVGKARDYPPKALSYALCLRPALIQCVRQHIRQTRRRTLSPSLLFSLSSSCHVPHPTFHNFSPFSFIVLKNICILQL